MKVSYLFYLDSADVENIEGICKKNKIPKIVIEGFNKIIMPLFNSDDEKEVEKHLKLINSKFKNNVNEFFKLRNYSGEKFFVKITVDCKRNQLSKIDFFDIENNNRKIKIIVDFENTDYMYDFIYKNVYDKFFPSEVLKEAKESLTKVFDQIVKYNKIDLKEKKGFKKIISLVKKNYKLDKVLENNTKKAMKKYFDEIQMAFGSYNFFVNY